MEINMKSWIIILFILFHFCVCVVSEIFATSDTEIYNLNKLIISYYVHFKN